ncbi:uncharacterized protein [Parasteatoda tepidariorum]|uniref:uncharacterized protein n=1 Tax=Parasteatoda tepidariorum TaxID=114398 RepID=UPI00077FB851|nr:uncharacterized protein LOC107445390 [Parasteatoda tepidariorum]
MLVNMLLISFIVSTMVELTPCTSMSQTYSSFLKDLIRRQSYNAQMESRDKRQINRRSWCCGDSLSSSISSMTKQIRRGLQYGWKMTAQIISLYNGIRGIIALFSPNSSQMQDTQDIVDQLRNKTKQSVFEYLKMIGLN